MKKIFVILLLISFGLNFLVAQNSNIFPRPNSGLEEGKALFNQAKYAAAYRYFEASLQGDDLLQVDRQEAEYYLAVASYYLKDEDAYNRLRLYLEKYPYSPVIDQVNFVLGKLNFEKKEYGVALRFFNLVDEGNLNTNERVEKMYSEAYALMKTGKYERSSALFKQVSLLDVRYNVSAKYYYAYSQYMLNNFDHSLELFLELEKLEDYKKKVGYYIVQIYFQKRDYEAMVERVEELLENDADNPNNAELFRLLGEIEYEKEDYERAIDFLLTYEKLTKQMLRNDIYFLGLSYYKQKKYDKTIEYLSRVTVKADSMSENAYLHIGNSYLNLNDITNAKMAFESALSTSFDPTVRETALYNYALATYDSNAVFGEAFSAFERLLAEFPNSRYADKAYSYLSSLYMTSKNYKKAYESISKMKGKNRKMIETKQYLLNQLGGESFVNADYSQALECFTLALQEAPNEAYRVESLYWRAETNYRLGDYEESVVDLKKFFASYAYRRSPNASQAVYLLGHSYFSLRDYSEATRYFKRYTESSLAPSDATLAESYDRLGDCYYYFRNFGNAQKQYEKAIQLSPQTGDYSLFQLAYIKGLQKDQPKKIALLEKIISDFPNSLYADNALYEIGRASLAMKNENQAIGAYKKLLSTLPNSKIAPKAALEIGLIYLNKKESAKAIEAFKNVISSYPATEEARTALESLEPIYIDQNKTGEYVEYAKTLGGIAQEGIVSKEDSILFVAGERLYFKKDYSDAIIAFKEYLDSYGEERSFSVLAKYYLANSYYNNNEKNLALKEYVEIAQMAGSKYQEEAIIRAAEITYDEKDYTKAELYFAELNSIATTVENKNIARLGVLRTSYILGHQQKTIDVASEIIEDEQAAENVKFEAFFNRAKAYSSQGKIDLAIDDLKKLENNTKTAVGAEAKFLLAEQYYVSKQLKESEEVVLDFAKKNTPYQYWLARSFVLLADIYIDKNDDFQAKQYLLSLRKNYTDETDVQEMISSRLASINKREQEKVIH